MAKKATTPNAAARAQADASHVPADPTNANLAKFDHLVILMMENRSFDQMLGYLTLTGRTDVDGLDLTMSNVYQPKNGGPPLRIGVAPAVSTSMSGFHDPCHKPECVDAQIANGMGGFVQSYHDLYPQDDPSIVMRYFQAKDVPVYDFIARQFSVGDHWFSSVAGDTWPNRLYAVSGSAAGSRDGGTFPLYFKEAFVRQLDAFNISWKGYGDPQHRTISLADGNYRSSPNYEQLRGNHMSFVGDAQRGQLPAVSWIDPHFFQNDDHPMADVAQGQALVSLVYSALANSPQWSRTLLVIVYDEHGGFFDHVTPPPAVDDDPATFGSCGVRVPVFFVGPYVDQGTCCKTVFDHTSLLKTMLLRFCATGGPPPDMGKRVAAAPHIGEVLSLATPRAAPPIPEAVVAGMAKVYADQFIASMAGAQPAARSESEEQLAAAVKQSQADMQATAAAAARPPRN